ncbi:hypothetical protein [Vibrio cyclitrophicus]|uniref:hypothetical protein n=1 Tax=Vibrio cyclitrophicus TaxID=47951 RepID=UPI000B2E9F97|nr:hypothetical protein [Vibrio cyclitrophicus]
MIKRKRGFFRAVTLYGIAVDASKRTAESPEQALVSLMFSFNSLEAFINETVTCCQLTMGGRFSEHEKTFFSVMNDLQKSKGSTQNKFQLGKLILSGKGWETSKAPYQDFVLLQKIRNELVHRKSEYHEDTLIVGEGFPEKTLKDHPSFFRQLESRKLCDSLVIDESWIDLIQTPAFAEWCCETAYAMTKEFLDSITDVPQSKLKSRMIEILDFNQVHDN